MKASGEFLLQTVQFAGIRSAGLLPTEMKWLKQLKDENSRLKKIVADLTLDRITLLQPD